MNTATARPVPDQRELVWCTLFASLFKFQTRCDSTLARRAAARAYARHGAVEPFAAVESVIRSELTWPANPEDDDDRHGLS
ncbi:hypothetical protein [Rhizobacter fulvus]